MAASAMPVLPLDGSRMVWPATRRPLFSACSIIDLAMRSLTEPNGFWPSSLATIRTSGLGDSRLTSTIGVLPIMSRTFSKGTITTPNQRWLTIYSDQPDQYGQDSISPDGDTLFGDRFVDDPIGPRFGRLSLQADDHVVPIRIGCLLDVGRAGVRLGVGVAVEHADDRQSGVVRFAIGAQQLLGRDRVDARRRRLVSACDEPLDLVAPADQQAAGRERIAVVRVADHLGECAGGHDQHRRGVAPRHSSFIPPTSSNIPRLRLV